MADPVSALALGTAASAASGTVAATAATAGLFGSAGSFSLLSTISTLGTVGSVFGTLSSASASNQLSRAEARQADFNARQEEIRGIEEAAAIKTDVAKAIASANARGAAGGIDISSGSPVKASQEALADANRALSTSGINAKLRAEQDRVRAQIARRRGRNAIRSGQSKAVSILGDFGGDLAEKGFSF